MRRTQNRDMLQKVSPFLVKATFLLLKVCKTRVPQL